MKINLDSKDKWTAKERKKMKSRAIFIIVLISVIAVGTASLFIYSYLSKTKGLIYPNVKLEDSLTGSEPKILPTEGYEQVVKTPTLPYTLLTKGDVVKDSDSFCIFLVDEMYASIAEVPKNAETGQYLQTAVIPSLNGSVSSVTSFKKQTGFMNERQIESQGTTITLTNNSNIYAMNIRVFLSYDKDILISVISSRTNMKDAEKIAENIFYSLRLLEDAQTQQINNQSGIGAITVDDLENIGIEQSDWDTVPEDETDNPYIDNYQTEWEIQEPDGYIEGETYTFTLYPEDGADSEWVYFAYYLTDDRLKEIKLEGPDGTIYEYDGIKWWDTGLLYGFHVGKGMSGEWTFTWTAQSRIGEFYTGYGSTASWNSLHDAIN